MLPEKRQESSVWKATEIGSPTHDFNTRVVLASKEPKLMYVKDLRTKWKQLVAKINILLGGTDQTLPTTEELEVMINYAQDNWYNFRLSDIELAVNANISRKTEEYVEYYGKVSVGYLQSCISNYHDVKRKAILEYKRREESEKTRTHEKEPDEVVNFKLCDGLCKFVREQGRIPEIWDWTRCYDHLEAENGEGWLSIDEKRQIYAEQTAIFEAKQQKSKQQAQTVAELREITDSDSERAIQIACKRFVVERELRKYLPESN